MSPINRSSDRPMPRWAATLVIAVLCLLGHTLIVPHARAQAPRPGAEGDIRQSIVRILTTSRLPDLRRPWTRQTPQESSGTGFVISGNRILTNAHVVDYARRVLVQPYQSSDELEARVVAVARGIDLAIIELEDPAFFNDHPPLTLSEDLPAVGTTVNAFGYPLGGEALSVTEGIVNRIEFTGYKAGTRGLRIQVDAALNPGNSGGPVLSGAGADPGANAEVIGVVFSGIPTAENTGYLIPVEEVNKFLDDVEDGTYDGSPQVFYTLQTAENPALRSFLNLAPDATGLVVHDPEGHDDIKRWDVITKIGTHQIANDGMVFKDDLRINWTYYVHDVAEPDGDGGFRVPVTIIRDGQQLEVNLEAALRDQFLFEPLDGGVPDYAIIGPMCFTPISREMAEALLQLGPRLAVTDHPVLARFADEPAFEGEQLVTIVPPFFPHRLTRGYELAPFPVVDKVNGIEIKNLQHLVDTLYSVDDDYLIFEWQNEGMELLVFPRKRFLDATEDVLDDNGIRSQFSDGIAIGAGDDSEL